MDAFFAAVEQRDRPELEGRPVIIGADPKGGRGRGVVSTASYEARRFGVGSAMPISQAFRACPHGVYLPPDIELYSRESQRVMDILRRVTDRVEPVSIDEAFLDVTGSIHLFGPPRDIAVAIRAGVRKATGLPISVGGAHTKFLAKVASRVAKPDGLLIVASGSEVEFLHQLTVDHLWGVGPAIRRLHHRRVGGNAGPGPRHPDRHGPRCPPPCARVEP
jgi:nucleotidyltransferase/DNA polymerase involved in DNA repair